MGSKEDTELIAASLVLSNIYWICVPAGKIANNFLNVGYEIGLMVLNKTHWYEQQLHLLDLTINLHIELHASAMGQ